MDFTIPEYELDYTKPIIGYGNFTDEEENKGECHLDQGIVEEKFRLWNMVGHLGILENNELSQEEKDKAILLLTDKTIYTYAMFKFDGNPMKARYFQDVMMSDKHKRILCCSSNQLGKSIFLNMDAASEFMMDHGKGWVGLLISKSLSQSKYQMMRIKQMLNSSDISYKEENSADTKTGKQDSAFSISYTFYDNDGKPLYTNLLICSPPSGSALGYPTDRMWLDEFDYWENIDQDWFMNQIAIPRTIETKGTIIVISNPDGKNKMMYKLWNQTYKDGTHIWHRYNFNYWDKANTSQHEFEMLTSPMTKHQRESTMLAVFSDSAGSFFSHQEIYDSFDKELDETKDSVGYGKETFWFLDVGVKHDQSVLVGCYKEDNEENPDIPKIKIFKIHKYPVGYPLSRVVGVEDGTKDDGWEDYAADNPSVLSILNDYSDDNGNMPVFGFDATGNSGLLPLFQTAGIDGMDIIFSGKKKWEMYQRYKYYMEKRLIKRVNDCDNNTINGKDWTYQAGQLMIKPGKTSYKQIHHEKEDDYDDTQDATAGVIHLADNPYAPSLQFELFENEPVSKKMEGQYLPKWMKRGEVQNRLEKIEAGRI